MNSTTCTMFGFNKVEHNPYLCGLPNDGGFESEVPDYFISLLGDIGRCFQCSKRGLA